MSAGIIALPSPLRWVSSFIHDICAAGTGSATGSAHSAGARGVSLLNT
jgi:hypothetical protein